MMTKKQIKLTSKKISNWLATAAIFSVMIILALVSVFLYKNFYQTITQSKEIIILKEKVAQDAINMERFNSIMDKLTKKTAYKELSGVPNPFR